MPKYQEPVQESINLVGEGTTINGDIKAIGDMRIDGTVIGKVSSSGRIIIGNSGLIEGEVICKIFEISGNFKGKIEVAEIATLKETARFQGEMIISKLAIEPGAFFSGSCKMQIEAASIKEAANK